MTKLTYEEYKKACDAGMSSGNGACCCMGPQGNDEYCPCRMNILGMLTEDGQLKIKQDWISRSQCHERRLEAEKDDLEKSPFRKKRMELLAKKTKG